MSKPSMPRAFWTCSGARLAAFLVFLACLAASDMPEITVRAAYEELTGILYAPPSDARDQEVASLIARYVDFEEIARRSFGEPCPQPGCVDHWAALSPAQRVEIEGLLQSSLTATWTRQLARAGSYDLEIKPAVAVPKSQELRVHVTARPKEGIEPTTTLDLFFLASRTPYRLVDQSVHGRLTVRHYKQYDGYLTNSDQGYPYLVGMLRRHTLPEASVTPAPSAEAVDADADAAGAPPEDAPADSSVPDAPPHAPQERGVSFWKLMLGGALLLAAGVWLGRLRRKS